MGDDLRKQIYDTLNLKETGELLEIWQKQDTDEWQPVAFEIIAQILTERLGAAPPQPVQTEVDQILKRVDSSLQARELDQALRICEQAIQLAPGLAEAYAHRGQIYDKLGQVEEALADYRTAIHLDPKSRKAWDGLNSAEQEIEEEFQASPEKEHLDQALEFALNDEPEKALEECELARPDLPDIASAYNYIGALAVELTPGDLREINRAISKITVQGDRYPEADDRSLIKGRSNYEAIFRTITS